MIGRRKFITAIGAAAAWPVVARAQQAGKLPTIGFLGTFTPSPRNPFAAAFLQRLNELGWIEGRTVEIVFRWSEHRAERHGVLVADLVRLKVDVIVTTGGAAALPRRQHRLSLLCSRSRQARSVVGWLQAWRDPAATSPACRTSRPMLSESASSFCGRSSPIFGG